MLKACECLQAALVSENPCGYLRVCASSAMSRYCNRYVSLIRTDYDHNGFLPPQHVESLDIVIDTETEETAYDLLPEPQPVQEAQRDLTALYEAVEQLPARQRETISRHYGLQGPAEPLSEIAESFRKPGSKASSTNVYQHQKEALTTLSKRLRVLADRSVHATQEVYSVSQACRLLG